VIASFFDLHGNMANEIDTLLEESTDHDRMVERRTMDREAKNSKSEFPMYTYLDEEVEVDLKTLNQIRNPTIPNRTNVPSTANKTNING
jgi:hypothetical protein